jgi:uncharacterized protein (DUF697 family)
VHAAWSPYLGALEPERAERIARGGDEEKARAARDLIHKTSTTAAVSALQPIPVLDAAILTPLQHRMVRSLGVIRGARLEPEQVKCMFRAVKRPIVLSQTMLAVAKLVQFIPWAPEVFALSLAYALTFAIGQVSDEYLARKDIPTEELSSRLTEISKERFTAAFEVKRDEVRALFRDPETRRRIGELRKAHRKGTIDDEEVARRMDAILGGLEPG